MLFIILTFFTIEISHRLQTHNITKSNSIAKMRFVLVWLTHVLSFLNKYKHLEYLELRFAAYIRFCLGKYGKSLYAASL